MALTLRTIRLSAVTLPDDTVPACDDTADISMRLSYSPHAAQSLLANLVPAHRRCRGPHHVNFWNSDMPVPVRELPNLAARLAYLRIDAVIVSGFLELELLFSALRGLHIDLQKHNTDLGILEPPDYRCHVGVLAFSTATPRVWAPCPALEHVTHFALRESVTGIDSRRITFLAYTFGQLGRQAVLTLRAGFAEPVAGALLAQTVATVRRRALAGRGSREDLDGGLWDCRLFNRGLEGPSA